MKKYLPWWLLALVFVVLPVVEIYLLIQVGQVIGALWTVLLLVADAFLGSYLVKREGSRAWAALREAVRAGRLPHRELADGALVLAGGTLLITPGFVTDVFGIVFILPFTRPIARGLLARVLARRLVNVSAGPGSAPGSGPGSGPGRAPGPGTGPGAPRTQQRPGPDSVVQGEVVD